MVLLGGLEVVAAGYILKQRAARRREGARADAEDELVRRGYDPRTSVLNAYNQMHEVPNVFISDGSCMTSGACLNPSLTFMALTARACDHAVRQLKRGDL